MKKSKKYYKRLILISILVFIVLLGILLFFFNTSQITISTSNAGTSTSIIGDSNEFTEINFIYNSDCDSGSEFLDYGSTTDIIISFSNLHDEFGLPRAVFPEEEYKIRKEINFPINQGYISFLSSGELKEKSIILNESYCKVRPTSQLWESSPSGSDCTYLPSGMRCSNGAIKTTRISVYDCNIKSKYICNNQAGCNIKNVCKVDLQFNAYKEGYPKTCPTGQNLCEDQICRDNCNSCKYTGCPTGYSCTEDVCKQDNNLIQILIIMISIIIIIVFTMFVIYFIMKKLKKKR